jgi:hypothetical protein
LEAVTAKVPDEMYEKLWALQFATQAANQPIVAKTGWVTYISVRDYPSAARHFAAEGHLTEAARAHADAAAVYRQAALLSAQSIIQVYGVDPRETDPVGASHLLTVSYALLAELDKAKEASTTYAAVEDDPAKAWHAPWAAWLSSGAQWPPDLSGLPSGLGPPKVGASPNTELPVPHYELPEVGADSKRPMGDPGYLVQMALWHDAAAKEGMGGDPEGFVPMYRAAYRFPVEPEATARVELPGDWVLASDHLSPWDAAFMAAVTGSEGLDAVEQYKDRSFVASVAAIARQGGTFDPQVAIDFAAGIRPNLMERMQAANGGEPLHQHPMWAEYVQSALMRDLAIVAGLDGDREVSGRLYLGALDRASTKSSACPVAFMAVAAWDAENRYPTRALEFVHNFARRYPSLKVARFSADLLGLRVSRERVGEAGGM